MSASLTRRRRQEIRQLVQKKHRAQRGEMLVEGVRAVASAVRAGAPLVEIVVSEAARQDPQVRACVEEARVPVHVLPARELERLADAQTSQGVLAVARTVWTDEADLAAARSVLVLDGVQDPGNVGALLRTAAWFGAEAVLAGPGTADYFGPKVVRAAAGSLWDVRLARTSDLPARLRQLRAAGFPCYGADLAGTPVQAWTPHRPSALVMGSEAHGLSPEVRGLLDVCVSVPGAAEHRGVESLNVAVAAGILMHYWLGRASVFT